MINKRLFPLASSSLQVAFPLISLLLASPALAAPTPGDTLPPLSLTSASGGTRPLWARGHITVVSFCAFWCDTWKEQSRRMASAQEQTRGLPVDWQIVSVDGRWSDKSREPGWTDLARTALLDTGGNVTNRLKIHAVPTTLVVDETGRVLLSLQGIARSNVILQSVRAILNGDGAQDTTPVRLVFDDFPSRDARQDDHLLDILRAANVKAILCGSNQRRQNSPAITRRAKAEGHELKAPFGNATKGVVDAFDWKRPGRDELMRRVLNGAAPGKIVLLHAGVNETLEALPALLDSLHRRGLL
ncbi:hypothetical protein IAD21_03277 [Abditibacteriota bacterium]|nr:hypothetical protein IAD21_03277 [Abditibacteriota bacterium]